MKNKLKNLSTTKSRSRVALLLVLATSIIGLAPAFSTSARAGSFGINDVSGNYVYHGQNWGSGGTKHQPESVPGTGVGLVTFTPATGTFHIDLVVRLDGTNLHPIKDGTYTVDATGHGTMTWLSGTIVRQIDFYIVNGGAELKWIQTDPANPDELSLMGTMTKQ